MLILYIGVDFTTPYSWSPPHLIRLGIVTLPSSTRQNIAAIVLNSYPYRAVCTTGRGIKSSCLFVLFYTVKCCRTISAFNSVLLPWAITAPFAITTYFSASRAAKWSPCSTNRIAKRRERLKPMMTSSI